MFCIPLFGKLVVYIYCRVNAVFTRSFPLEGVPHCGVPLGGLRFRWSFPTLSSSVLDFPRDTLNSETLVIFPALLLKSISYEISLRRTRNKHSSLCRGWTFPQLAEANGYRLLTLFRRKSKNYNTSKCYAI